MQIKEDSGPVRRLTTKSDSFLGSHMSLFLQGHAQAPADTTLAGRLLYFSSIFSLGLTASFPQRDSVFPS